MTRHPEEFGLSQIAITHKEGGGPRPFAPCVKSYPMAHALEALESNIQHGLGWDRTNGIGSNTTMWCIFILTHCIYQCDLLFHSLPSLKL